MIRRVLSSSLVLGLAGVSMSQFVPGRVVVSGPTSTANSNGYNIVFRQLLPSLISQAFSSTYTTGTTLPDIICMNGNSPTEGKISRSSLGRFLYFPGYNSPAVAADIANTSSVSASGIQRVIGRLDFSGNLNTNSTLHYGTQVSAFSTNNIRSATMSENVSTPGAWAIGSNTGLVYSPFGTGYTPNVTTNSTLISAANTNNRQVVVFRNAIFAVAAAGNVGIYRVDSLATAAATMSRIVNTTSATIPQSTPAALCVTSDSNATASTGNVYIYVADEGSGIIKYTSTSGWLGAFSQSYRISTSNCYAVCADGNVVYAVSTTGVMLAIWDGGSSGNSFQVTLSSSTPIPRGIALAPAPLVADSDYSSGGAVSGNIMTLRDGNDSVKRYRVGIVPDSSARGFTEFTSSPGTAYTGTVIGSAVDSAGNAYLAIQSIANSSNTMVPAITVQKVPYGGGTTLSSNTVNLPTDYEAFGIFVDDTNRPVVACRGASNLQTVRLARWAADLTGGSLNATTFTSGTRTPVDISAEPGGYAILGFGSSGSFGWNSVAADFTSSANGTVTISADGSNALTPISAKFGANDGFLRVMSAGTGANRALFRIDSLNSAKTTATAATRSYRRDGTAPAVSYTDNNATSPAFMLPWTMSMSTNGPKVLMLHTSEPNSGPSGPGVGAANRNDVYVGAGRIWSFDTNNVLAAPGSTYRFAPGLDPVN